MSGKKIAFKITFSVVIMESNTKFITQVTDYVSRNDYLSIQNLKQSHAQEKKKGKKKNSSCRRIEFYGTLHLIFLSLSAEIQLSV